NLFAATDRLARIGIARVPARTQWMKAEERHRLQENELQRLAEHARERTRPFFERYGTTLLLALAAVLLIVAAIVWWVRSSGAGSSAGWSELAAVFRKG